MMLALWLIVEKYESSIKEIIPLMQTRLLGNPCEMQDI